MSSNLLPKYFYETATEKVSFFNVDAQELIRNSFDKTLHMFSENVELLLEEKIETPFKKVLECIIGDQLYATGYEEGIIKRYLMLIVMRSYYYFDTLNGDKSEDAFDKDLSVLIKTKRIYDLCENTEVSDRLRFLANQFYYGYLTLWKPFHGAEFVLSDKGYAISPDLSPGIKLFHATQLASQFPAMKFFKDICDSLDYLPMNFVIFPIKKDLAIGLCSPFMKLFTKRCVDYRPDFSIFNLTLSGLYDDTFNEPFSKKKDKYNDSLYIVKELSRLETLYCDELIIDDTIKIFSWENSDEMKKYFENYTEKGQTKHDISKLTSNLY